MNISARSLINYRVEITAGRHTFLADEPAGVGDDTGPDPYALLLGALAACTIMTLRMYAERKAWPLEGVEMQLNTYKDHAKDCEQCEVDPNARVDVIDSQVRLLGPLSAEQVARLLEIAEMCPVHRTLTGDIRINTTLAEVEA